MEREQVAKILAAALAGTKRVKVAFTPATADKFQCLTRMANQCHVQLVPENGTWEGGRLICLVALVDVFFVSGRFLDELAEALAGIEVIGPGR